MTGTGAQEMAGEVTAWATGAGQQQGTGTQQAGTAAGSTAETTGTVGRHTGAAAEAGAEAHLCGGAERDRRVSLCVVSADVVLCAVALCCYWQQLQSQSVFAGTVKEGQRPYGRTLPAETLPQAHTLPKQVLSDSSLC